MENSDYRCKSHWGTFTITHEKNISHRNTKRTFQLLTQLYPEMIQSLANEQLKFHELPIEVKDIIISNYHDDLEYTPKVKGCPLKENQKILHSILLKTIKREN